MSYVVCIPSYKRAQICTEKTLAMLKANGIEKSKIYVYVANREEYAEYLQVLDKGSYNKLIIGQKGLVQQRRFISGQWPEGKNIVYIDDDVKSIDLKMSEYKTLDAFFKSAFAECRRQKSYIWGIYPVYNPFFRKGQKPISTCLNYIVGAFYGNINRPHLKAIRTTLTEENGQKTPAQITRLPLSRGARGVRVHDNAPRIVANRNCRVQIVLRRPRHQACRHTGGAKEISEAGGSDDDGSSAKKEVRMNRSIQVPVPLCRRGAGGFCSGFCS